MAQVTVVDHPLVQHHLTRLRACETNASEFRASVSRLAVLLTYKATQDLSLTDTEVYTPLTKMTGKRLQPRVGLVPILRAGLGMVDPVLDLLPEAEVWHLGLYRDEATAQPVEYYSKLPNADPVDVGLVLDPMLATGGSAASALAALIRWGVPSLKLLSLIAAPEGIAALELQFPEAQVYVCAIDERLDDQKFIVPGLGDAGDRSFNTLPADD